jgi:hypothetical protein
LGVTYWGISEERKINKSKEEAHVQEIIKFEKKKEEYDLAMSDLVNKYRKPDKVISLNVYQTLFLPNTSFRFHFTMNTLARL